MPLRVTQGMMTSQLLRNINSNIKRMDNSQYQLSTGRKLNKPSDDPVGITYALRYRSEISSNEQYQRNLDSAQAMIDHTDTTLGQLNDVLTRVTELTVQGTNGTNPQTALDAIASELKALKDQAIAIGNDQLKGKYIFNGEMTNQLPYTTGDGTEETDTGKIMYEFGAGVVMPINTTGNEVFGKSTDADNLFKVLDNIINAFSPSPPGTPGTPDNARNQLANLQSRLDKLLTVRAEVGARANRMELLGNRLKDIDMNLQSLSGKTEDADYAELITKLKTDENVYQASLSVGSKMIQPSLIDFLR